MPIVEFGKSDSRRRAIVPQEERIKAQEDAVAFGTGFLVDERRVDPSKVEIVLAEDAPAILRNGLQEFFNKKARHG